ncbi:MULTISPECIES: hypothetical protein [unclassified Flavobacterium]|uniref:hypothetical protein n=1 Tax=unclassified Flavobacterium TaxID=196869 RepID=UPI000F0C33FA|nr:MULTISPECIES: hypothetical protein [unclassified Flavobacterium]AYN02935.1 hypothetical protein EAG11_01215 [Flavobacterium sp. 140616W15]MCD0473166.1 hypothetical protein [Flavobacterium sp. EDS]
MKAFFPTILLMLLTTFGVQAQTTSATTNPFPSITTLTSWASYNSQSKFDIEVRGIGFKFEVKSVEEGSTAYTYIRKVIVNDISYTDRIVYRIANGNTASIISLVTASTDLVSLYTPQLSTYKSNNCKTEMSKDKNTTCSCYENANYSIDLCDERVKLTMGDGNKYFISVAKK